MCYNPYQFYTLKIMNELVHFDVLGVPFTPGKASLEILAGRRERDKPINLLISKKKIFIRGILQS